MGGPFILAERDLNLPFRGSRNQRIIDMRRSLRQGNAVSAEIA
ncbi:organic radical activating enzymes [Calderihabitans maritimus]|uniref:Organic radical activating enzymes n=1 Tax=Calderihabitans maritimus TaxID=1246530 RepID=A0A1Z5HTE0_9FIRM|nr:organic radical activating enzymes [Calderihabitans maritimus]